MARGDSIFARLDVSLLMDPRWRKLSAAGKVTLITLLLTSVEHRLSTLPTQYDQAALADRTGLDRRTYEKALQKCIEVGFVKLTPDGRVFVPNVKENHEKMRWNDSGIFPDSLPHIGPTTGSEREEKIEKIEKKEEKAGTASDRSVPRAPAPPPSDPEPAKAIVQDVLHGLDKQEHPPLIQPTPERIEYWYEQFDPSKPKCQPYELMKVVARSHIGNKVFDEARRRLSGEVIRRECAFIEAMHEGNDGMDQAGAVLVNRLKDRLSAIK